MRRLPPLPLQGPAGLLALALAVLLMGSGGMLVANEIAARSGERSGYEFFNTEGERFEEVVTVRADDNAGTSLAFSKLAYPQDGSAQTVVIGRDDVFADNLAAGLLQRTGPLLLTDGQVLNASVRDEVLRLGAKKVFVVGGPKAIDPRVEQELRDLGVEVQRLAGPTRIETALAIARHAAPTSGRAVLVRARDEAGGDTSRAWADSLAAGAFAAASGVPVLLTDSASLHPAVAAYLGDAGVTEAFVIGGRAAVSDGVLASVGERGIAGVRVSGAERAETAVRVAQELWGFTGSQVAREIVLVDGYAPGSWAAGVSAAAFSARFSAPIVLSDGATIPPATEAWIEQGGGRMVCGESVQDDACRQAAAAPQPAPTTSPSPSPTASPTRTPRPQPPQELVKLSHSHTGSTIFHVRDLLPGQTRTRQTSVRNVGNKALDVRLHGAATGELAPHLTLEIFHLAKDGTRTKVFPLPATPGDTSLEAFGTAHHDYETGLDNWRARPGDNRRYEFVVSLPGTAQLDDELEEPGKRAEATFTWEGFGQ